MATNKTREDSVKQKLWKQRAAFIWMIKGRSIPFWLTQNNITTKEEREAVDQINNIIKNIIENIPNNNEKLGFDSSKIRCRCGQIATHNGQCKKCYINDNGINKNFIK